jgi:hypothetical protein
VFPNRAGLSFDVFGAAGLAREVMVRPPVGKLWLDAERASLCPFHIGSKSIFNNKAIV